MHYDSVLTPDVFDNTGFRLLVDANPAIADARRSDGVGPSREPAADEIGVLRDAFALEVGHVR